MSNAPREENRVPGIVGLSSVDSVSSVIIKANPATGALLTEGGGSSGAIVDGVSSAIKATVLDYTSSNPVAVRLTDTNGDFTSNSDVRSQVITASGTAGALNADAIASTDVSKYAWFSVQITGTYSGTMSWQGSNDGSTWAAMNAFPIGTASGGPANSTTSVGIWHGPLSVRYLRIRMTSYTSGTANVSILVNAMPNFNYHLSANIANNVGVAGTAAHDAANSGNPIKIGGRTANFGATPTAVTLGDVTDGYFSRNGMQFVLGGTPDTKTVNVTIADADGAQTNLALVTVAASTAIVVTSYVIKAHAANSVNVSAWLGFGTASVPTPAATPVLGLLENAVGIAPGNGVIRGNGGGILGVGASDEDLRLTCDDPVGGSLSVTVTYFTVAI